MRQNSIVELLIAVVSALTPLFLMANEVDGDEYAKSGLGLASAGSVVAVYRLWKGKHG